VLDDLIQCSVNIRIEKARECLRDAETMLSVESYAAAANRSYYCVFHAMRAVLCTIGFATKKHSGIIAEFRLRFIKSGIFPVEFSDIIGVAFEIRNDSDYKDFFVISKADVAEQIKNAKTFLTAVDAYLKAL